MAGGAGLRPASLPEPLKASDQTGRRPGGQSNPAQHPTRLDSTRMILNKTAPQSHLFWIILTPSGPARLTSFVRSLFSSRESAVSTTKGPSDFHTVEPACYRLWWCDNNIRRRGLPQSLPEP